MYVLYVSMLDVEKEKEGENMREKYKCLKKAFINIVYAPQPCAHTACNRSHGLSTCCRQSVYVYNITHCALRKIPELVIRGSTQSDRH